MFAYCLNNPVNYEDSEGEFPVYLIVSTGIGVVLGGMFGVLDAADDVVNQYSTYKKNIEEGGEKANIIDFFSNFYNGYQTFETGVTSIASNVRRIFTKTLSKKYLIVSTLAMIPLGQ